MSQVKTSRPRHLAMKVPARWVVAVAGLLVALAAAEATARLWLRLSDPALGRDERCSEIYEEPGEYWGRRPTNPEWVYDTYLGYAPRPSSSGDGYHINAAGFRYPEDLPPEPGDGELRAFLTGGSTAWGCGIPRDELTVAGRLERLLQARLPGRKTRVVNAAGPGYCLTQERVVLENRVLDYAPDVVLMLTGYNEMAYAWAGVDTLRTQDHFTWRARVERRIRTGDGAVIPAPPLPGDYALKLRYLLDGLVWKLRVGDRREQMWTYSRRRRPLPPDRFAAIARRNLGIVGQLSREEGFRVIVALQPDLLHTGKPLSPHERRALWSAQQRAGWAGLCSDYLPVLRQVMAEACRRHGMRFVSLTHVFDGCPEPVFYDGCHFGDRGASIVAEALIEQLAEEAALALGQRGTARLADGKEAR
jgi:hypothetical protein